MLSLMGREMLLGRGEGFVHSNYIADARNITLRQRSNEMKKKIVLAEIKIIAHTPEPGTLAPSRAACAATDFENTPKTPRLESSLTLVTRLEDSPHASLVTRLVTDT